MNHSSLSFKNPSHAWIICRMGGALVLSSFLVSCQSIPVASPQEDLEVKEFRVSDRGSRVYMIRKSGIAGSALLLDVFLDRAQIAQLKPGMFVTADVSAGPHTFAATFEGAFKLVKVDFQVEPKDLHFFLVSVAWGGQAVIEELNEEEGKRIVRDSQLVATPD